MSSSYRIRYLLSAPVIVIVGLAGIFWGGRAVAFGGRAKSWADSLDKGSGPVRIEIPFVPIFVNGTRIGMLDTVVVQRHAKGAVDSLRIVVKPLASANAAQLATCAYRVRGLDQFDPSEYSKSLTCAADTAGLARFGRIAFGGGHEAVLYIDADQLSCDEPSTSVDVSVTAPAVAQHVVVQSTCSRHATMKTRSRRVQVVNGANIQQIVRQAREQARQAQEQGRQAREQARQAQEQARQAAEAVRHSPH